MTIESLHRTGIVFPSFLSSKINYPFCSTTLGFRDVLMQRYAMSDNKWTIVNISLWSYSVWNACVSLSRNKKYIGNSPVEEAKKINCYKRVICQNVSRTVVELCMETPYWSTVLVHQYGRRKSTKTSGVHFFYKSSFFPSRTSIRTHKHIF